MSDFLVALHDLVAPIRINAIRDMRGDKLEIRMTEEARLRMRSEQDRPCEPDFDYIMGIPIRKWDTTGCRVAVLDGRAEHIYNL